MRIATAIAALLACLVVAAPQAAAQQGAGGFIETPLIQVSLNRTEVSTRLGESFGFKSRVENNSRATHAGLVAHLNVVGLSEGIYVDPEDWSEERTKSVPPLAPGESTEIDWDVTAVTAGDAAIYVTVLPRDDPGRGTFVSPAMDVRIAESKDLNTDGVLPLTLAVPAVVAMAAVAVRRRRRT